LEDLAGKVILDAGCGMGRFAEVCAAAGAEVHAVDLSLAVEAADRNLEGWPNVHIYQADIMNLPFSTGTFDKIYSIGVLHHTPDTKAAFLKLQPLLKPGGEIAIWVYSKRLQTLVGGTLLRLFTPYLPKKWLLEVSKVGIHLYRLHSIPHLGRFTLTALPTSLHPRSEWRWLDTFDWYSPRFQWKHSYPEVEAWFCEAGLQEIRKGLFEVSVAGRRPTTITDTNAAL
jgi:SAM-dependent methyltransferase